MPTATRTFRVFVSSTFEDLKAECDGLQRDVFPKLRKLCEENGARFQAIDLRWGVRDEAALDQQTMRICLEEIARCQRVTPRPNFIVLLGDRYGWRPVPSAIPADEYEAIEHDVAPAEKELLQRWYKRDDNAVPPVYDLQRREGDFIDRDRWAAEERRLREILLRATADLPEHRRFEYRASATEQEIVRGAMEVADAQEHVFGFFRTIADVPHDTSARDFIDLDERREFDAVAHAQLIKLKERLRSLLPGNIHDYDAKWQDGQPTTDHIGALPADLDECLKLNEHPDSQRTLCAEVWRRLSRVILDQIAQIEVENAVDQEARHHAEFGKKHTHTADGREQFVGREDILRAIDRYIKDVDRHPLVVHGESGSGKTALIARAAEQCAACNGNRMIVRRFIGATPGSSDGRTLIEGLCREISRRYGANDSDVPADYQQLVSEFSRRLAIATSTRPLVVFLDALDQLSDADHARNLAWLPSELPEHVRLIVTTVPGDCLDRLHRKLPGTSLITLGVMQREEAAMLLDLWLVADAGKTLQLPQRAEVLDKFAHTGLPLHLKLAFEEARRWKSYAPANETVVSANIPGVIGDLFARLSAEANHGPLLVSRSLGYLCAARRGLSEDELLDVLSRDEAVFSDFKERSRHEPPEQRLPVIVWSRLYFDLEPYLIERSADGAALLALYHRQLGTVAAAAYLAGDEQRRAHEHLAKYFAAQDYFLESVEVQRQRALATPPTPRLANRRKIDELCWQRLREAEETGACDVLEDTLGEFDAIEAAAEGGMLFGLLADFNSAVALISRQRAPQRVVQLIFEALRTDANFMARHPTTALQCLWNHCWWVDCAGVEDHYVITREESDAAPLPDHDELVSAIVRRWRARKAEARLETPWLRSRRPPRVRLGSGQRAVLRGHQMGVLAVAVAENDRLVSASYDQTVRIWDLTTGAQLFCIATPAVWNLAVSPDGASVAASGREHITIWDTASGLERTVVASAQPTSGGVSFGSDSSQLLVLSPDGVLTVHDTASGGIVRKTLLDLGNIRQATFSPRADKVCLLTLANELIIVSLGSGDVVLRDRQLGSATGVAWSPDGRRVVTGGNDGTLCLLDVSSAKIVRRPNALDGTAELVVLVGQGYQLAFAPDGTRFAAARESGRVDEHLNSVVVFESVSLTEVRRLAGHEDLVRALCFCSDNLLASGSADMSVRLWDLTNEGGARYSLRYTGSPLYGVAQFVPDGRSIVQESIDSSKTVFDVETGRPLIHWRDHRWNISSPPGPGGPYDLIPQGSETIVCLRATGDVVGWLPVRLHKFSIHPKRPLLAGHESESSYLHVYSIESEPAAPRIDGDPGEATTSFARLASLLRQEVSGSADELQKNQAVAAARGDWPQYGEFLAEEIAIWDRHGETEVASYLADVISRLPSARPVVRTTPSAPSTTAGRERASSLFAAARQSFRVGDLAGAVAKLEEAIVADPAFGPGHYSLCEYYAQMGRYDDAIRHATRAIECEPKDADAYNNRAVAYAEKRMPAEAEADFDNAIMLRPDFPTAIFNRGALHFNAGHVEAAARDWKRFLELKPQSERADFIRKVFAQIGIAPAC